MVNLNWTSYRIATPLTTKGGYFLIPPFTYSGISWLGASTTQTQFNFSASRKFSIIAPDKPTGADYMAMIRYRIGTRVFRYRLWNDDLFVWDAPLYNNQIIGANFVIEIASLDSTTTVTNDEDITVPMSLRAVVSDFSAIPSDYEDCVGTEVPVSTISVALPATLPMDFGAAGAWLDNDECECGCQPLGDSTAPEDETAEEAILDSQGNAILDADGNAILQP